jgi:hypothetical protein
MLVPDAVPITRPLKRAAVILPVGIRFSNGSEWLELIGPVKAFRMRSPSRGIPPPGMIIRTRWIAHRPNFFLSVHTFSRVCSDDWTWRSLRAPTRLDSSSCLVSTFLSAKPEASQPIWRRCATPSGSSTATTIWRSGRSAALPRAHTHRVAISNSCLVVLDDYSKLTVLGGPDGRAPFARVIWFTEAGEDVPRLVTRVSRRIKGA